MVMLQIIYHQYVVKRGLEAPYVSEAKLAHDAAGGEQTGQYIAYVEPSFSPC